MQFLANKDNDELALKVWGLVMTLGLVLLALGCWLDRTLTG